MRNIRGWREPWACLQMGDPLNGGFTCSPIEPNCKLGPQQKKKKTIYFLPGEWKTKGIPKKGSQKKRNGKHTSKSRVYLFLIFSEGPLETNTSQREVEAAARLRRAALLVELILGQRGFGFRVLFCTFGTREKQKKKRGQVSGGTNTAMREKTKHRKASVWPRGWKVEQLFKELGMLQTTLGCPFSDPRRKVENF